MLLRIIKTTNFAEIFQACKYKKVVNIHSESTLVNILLKPHDGPTGIVVKTQAGSRSNLGRPTDTPKITKKRFMNGLASDD